MPSSPATPYLYGGTFLFLLALIFLISATAVPRFSSTTATSTTEYSSITATAHIGAFQLCLEVIGVSACIPVDGSCSFTPTFAGQQSATGLALPYCGTFNAFRGFLVTALILTGFALLGALAHSYQQSPNPNIGHFTFVAALLAIVGLAISLVCWVSWGTAAQSSSFLGPDSTTSSVTTSHGPSFYLLISALVATILGLAAFLYGRVQQRTMGQSGTAGEPHYHSAPIHYASDVQLHQPLTQQ